MKRLVPFLLAGCGIFHGERVADRPRAPIDTTQTFGDFAPQPAPADPPDLVFVEPRTRITALRNGVRVVWLERRDLPITSATIAVGGGSGDGAPGAVSVLFHRLQTSIAPDLDLFGAEVNRFVAHDAAGIELATIEKQVGPSLAIAGQRFVKPSFEDIEGSRHAVAGAISSRPEALAEDAALELFGFRARASAEALAKLRPDDVARAQRALASADDVVIAIAGSFDAAATARVLESTFGMLPVSPHDSESAPVVTPTDRKRATIDRPKSAQTTIAIALPSPTLGDRDDAAFQIVCEILGSRANAVARERKGYSYGVRPSCGALFDRVLLVMLDAESGRAAEAEADVLAAVESLSREPPDDRELAIGRTRVGARLVGTFHSNRTASTVLALAALHGAKEGAFGDFWQRARNVSQADANAAVRSWYADPRVVLVGDFNR